MGDDLRQLVDEDELAYTTESQPNVTNIPPTVQRGRNQSSFLQSTASSLVESTEADLERLRDEATAPTKMRNIISMAVLTLINLLNYMDRYSIAGVLSDVTKYYNVSLKSDGLIQTSFVISYMLLSPVFGYLGDRYTRKYIMAGGIFFWSIFTLASSFISANSFGVFLLMRALVGVGEASYSTIAPTIIADLFVGDDRTKALTLFYFAIPVGSGLGYIVGSNMAKAIGPWQWALRFTPGLGLLCTVLIIVLLKEPRRGAADHSEHLVATSYISDLKYLLSNKTFMLSSAGFTCVAFVAGALALWAPNYIYKSILSRPEYVKESSVANVFGFVTIIAGLVGVLAGTMSARKLRKYTPRADPFVCAFGLLTSSVFLYLSLSLSRYSTALTWLTILIGETLLCLNWAIITDMLLYIVIPTRRSTAEAVQILMSHILGDAGSPFLVGVVADSIIGDQKKDVIVEYIGLQYALFITAFVCVLGGGFFLMTSLFVVQDRKKVDSLIAGTDADGVSASINRHGHNSSGADQSIVSDSDIQVLPADGRLAY